MEVVLAPSSSTSRAPGRRSAISAASTGEITPLPARITSVGHRIASQCDQRSSTAASRSVRTITFGSKAGHQPPSRCSRPSAHAPAAIDGPPKKATAAWREGNGTGQLASQRSTSATVSPSAAHGPASAIAQLVVAQSGTQRRTRTRKRMPSEQMQLSTCPCRGSLELSPRSAPRRSPPATSASRASR